MRRFRHHPFARAFSLLLALSFFGSQAFACCVVNRKIARAVDGWFAAPASASVAAPHSCCPSVRTSRPESHAPAADPTGCCIQDATQRTPQLVQAPLPVPDFHPVLLGTLPLTILSVRPGFLCKPQPRIASSPPLYLTSLSLLL